MIRLSQPPTDPAFVQDPYPFYDRAREGGDLFRWEEYGFPCATSHRAVTALLRDRRLGREVPAGRRPPDDPALAPWLLTEATSLLSMEPPRHTRLRGLVVRAFTSRGVAALQPEAEALCDRLIDAFPAGPFDLLAAYGQVVPVALICRLLGVPEAKGPDLVAWSNAMVAMFQARRSPGIERAAARAAQEFRDYLAALIAERRRRPGEDLLSHLIAAEEAGDRLSTDELVGTCILLLNAGHEATVHTIGNAAAILLREGATGIDEAGVEEALRLDPPLHLFTRWATEEVELFGHLFRPGEQVGCLLAAANRDPAAYPEPARYDPARRGPAHASLGAGIHFCVGAPLARMELLVALRRLLARCPRLRLAEAPRYADLYHFHGFERLMVEARPTAAAPPSP